VVDVVDVVDVVEGAVRATSLGSASRMQPASTKAPAFPERHAWCRM